MMLQFFQALISQSASLYVQFQILNIIWKETSAHIQGVRGAGELIVVIAAQNKEVDANPVDGVDYTAGAYGVGDEIGTGNFIVYKGTSANPVVTGLQRLTRYGLKVCEARTIDGQIIYNTL